MFLGFQKNFRKPQVPQTPPKKIPIQTIKKIPGMFLGFQKKLIKIYLSYNT